MGDTPEDQVLQGEVDFFQGYILYFQNEGLQSLKHLRNALQRVPETYHEIRGQIEILYGLANQMQGSRQEAITRLNDLLYKFKGEKSTRNTRLLVTQVYINIISGNLPEATLANQQLQISSRKAQYLYAEMWSAYLDGLLCFYRNDLDQAILYFQNAIENRYVLHTRATVDSMTGLALSYSATGQPDKAKSSCCRSY